MKKVEKEARKIGIEGGASEHSRALFFSPLFFCLEEGGNGEGGSEAAAATTFGAAVLLYS